MDLAEGSMAMSLSSAGGPMPAPVSAGGVQSSAGEPKLLS